MQVAKFAELLRYSTIAKGVSVVSLWGTRRASWALLALGLFGVACGRGAAVEPALIAPSRIAASNGEDALVLQRAGDLPVGQLTQIGQRQIQAAKAYQSASGRSCRYLHLTGPTGGEARLACSEGEEWFFVPNIQQTGQLGANSTLAPSAVSGSPASGPP